eukprot:177120-Prymnesium_polylepis.1
MVSTELRKIDHTLAPAQSNSYTGAVTRLSGSGGGSVVPLDGDRLARWARAGAERLGSVPVTRWGRVRSARVVGPEAPTERVAGTWEPFAFAPFGRTEGEGLTHD